MQIKYRKLNGYKYQTVIASIFETGFILKIDIDHDGYIQLTKDGKLTIKAGYCWDGPSGPTIDGDTNMRASLAHDALYQLMRESLLEQSCREDADKLFIKLCAEDGMSKFRQWIDYKGLRLFAASAAAQINHIEKQDQIYLAPSIDAKN